jgi:hypothetical protein
MSTVLICRDGREDAVLGNLALAQAMARGGDPVDVVFAGDALVALDTGTFEWSPNFLTREARARVIAGAEASALPLAHKDRDPRWSDVRALVGWAAEQPGVRILACPLWQRILGATELPSYLQELSDDELVHLLKDADTVIGGY